MRLRWGRTATPPKSFRASRENTPPQKAFALRAKTSSLMKLSRCARKHLPSKSFRASRENLFPQNAFALPSRKKLRHQKMPRFPRNTAPLVQN